MGKFDVFGGGDWVSEEALGIMVYAPKTFECFDRESRYCGQTLLRIKQGYEFDPDKLTIRQVCKK